MPSPHFKSSKAYCFWYYPKCLQGFGFSADFASIAPGERSGAVRCASRPTCRKFHRPAAAFFQLSLRGCVLVHRGPPACRACPLARGPTGRERDRRAGTLPATFRAWRESRYASKPVVSQMQRMSGSGPSGLIVMGPELAAARKLEPKSAVRSSPPQARIPCPSATTIKRAESP